VNDLAALLPLVAILALFWFMVVRPQRRRQQEVIALQNSIEVGQQVMMSSGIYGTVRSVTDDTARLEIAPGTEIKIARAAIARVVEPDHGVVGGPATDA
jgi:preprotein translocase subunit YajC